MTVPAIMGPPSPERHDRKETHMNRSRIALAVIAALTISGLTACGNSDLPNRVTGTPAPSISRPSTAMGAITTIAPPDANRQTSAAERAALAALARYLDLKPEPGDTSPIATNPGLLISAWNDDAEDADQVFTPCGTPPSTSPEAFSSMARPLGPVRCRVAMNEGLSAGQRAAALRAQAIPRGLKRRVLAAVGMDREGACLEAEARSWGAGEEGERRTAALLVPLGREGWAGFYDRRIPGLDRANADHVLVSPGGRVFMPDSKMWHARARVRVVRGRMAHGDTDKDRQVDGVLTEARLVGQALNTEVTPIIAVHNAPVDGGGFMLRGVPVIPADRLVELLRRNAGHPDPAEARRLALLADRTLPRYVE